MVDDAAAASSVVVVVVECVAAWGTVAGPEPDVEGVRGVRVAEGKGGSPEGLVAVVELGVFVNIVAFSKLANDG